MSDSPPPDYKNLQAEHSRLLREYHARGARPEIRAAVEKFVADGVAAGQTLDAENERADLQQILDHWGSLLYRIYGSTPEVMLADFDPEKLPTLADADCPYVGLSAFSEDKAGRFFGRERLLEDCARILRQTPLLAVVGQSGSGKSSLVSGGLRPALKAGAFPELPETAGCAYPPTICPGTEPLENLVRALHPHLTGAGGVEEVCAGLRADPETLAALLAPGSGTVLFVDQFEELFTLCDRDEGRAPFLRALLAFLGDGREFRRVVVTMRSEFETWVGRTPELATLFRAGELRLPPMDEAELRRAIEEPAAAVGLKFERGVVDALVHDALGEPAALPLLQFTLLKLWERRRHNRILLADYQAVGGVRLALARAADEFYQTLTPEKQTTARRILLRMVRTGDGLEVHGQRTRLDDLLSGGESPERVKEVVEQLAGARLVRLTQEGSASGAQIEVAHEALIRNWPRLQDWIQTMRGDLVTRRRLNEYASEWLRRDRHDAGLLDDERLREAETWIKSDAALEFGYDAAIRELITASRRRQQAVRDEAARRLRNRSILATAMLLTGSLLLAVGIYYFVRAHRLDKEVVEKGRQLNQKQEEIDAKQHKIDFLTESLQHLTPLPDRALPTKDITVEYTGDADQRSRIASVLDTLAFRAHPGASGSDASVNTLLYGSQVDFAVVQKLACALIDAGIPLRAVGRLAGVDGVGARVKLLRSDAARRGPLLKPEEVMVATDRLGPDLATISLQTTPGATVQVFYCGEAQLPRALSAAAALAEVGYHVPPPSDIDARQPGRAPKKSELRYFRPQKDQSEALFLARLLSSFDPELGAIKIPDPKLAVLPTSTFELWFSREPKEAPGGMSQSTVPRVFITAAYRKFSEDDVSKVQSELEQSNFWVCIERADSLKLEGSELQYYGAEFPQDAKEAEDLAGLLRSVRFPVDRVATCPHPPPPGARSRRYELLLP